MENNIDPDKYFYNNINRTCEYYTDEQFKSKIIMDGTLSIIHFNSRSLHSNFFKMKDYLKFCSMFSVIAASETWLTIEKEAAIELRGYELFSTNREYKNGGGVALFVNNKLRCKKVMEMSTKMENIMECVTVEIEVEKTKNI